MESTVLNVNNLKVGFWSDKELFYAVQDVSFPYSEEKLRNCWRKWMRKKCNLFIDVETAF